MMAAATAQKRARGVERDENIGFLFLFLGVAPGGETTVFDNRGRLRKKNSRGSDMSWLKRADPGRSKNAPRESGREV
jgi:hypothetical protein